MKPQETNEQTCTVIMMNDFPAAVIVGSKEEAESSKKIMEALYAGRNPDHSPRWWVDEVPITSFVPPNPRTFEQYEISACILDSILDPSIAESEESWVRLRDIKMTLLDLTGAERDNVAWTLYGFSQNNLTTAIADRRSLEDAHELYYQITGVDMLAELKKSSDTTFYLPAFPGQKLD